MVAPPLLAHVAEGVLAPALVELVEDEDPREVEHVDLLELARGAVLRRHHVERDVDEVDDGGITLADSRRLDDNEIEALGAHEGDRVVEHRARRRIAPARGERAHEHAPVAQAVHPDPVAEQRPAGAAPGGIDREDSDARLREVLEETGDELVGDGALARPARAGDADDGHGRPGRRPLRAETIARRLGHDLVLESGERSGDRQIGGGSFIGGKRRELLDLRGALDQVGDHPFQPELLAVAREIHALHAVRLQLGSLLCGDRAATTTEDANVPGTLLAQHVDRVLEVLEMAALIGADRDPVGILLDRRAHDVRDAAVVAEVDDLGAGRLDQAAHHVDRRVVPVEERRRGHEAKRRGLRCDLVLLGAKVDGGRAHERHCSLALDGSCKLVGVAIVGIYPISDSRPDFAMVGSTRSAGSRRRPRAASAGCP